jgi:hypothetical protein
MKEKLPVDSDPVDGTDTYTASSTFGSGSVIGTGNYVVYKGIGSQVTVTNLFSDLPYYVAVYAYNGAGASIDYRQTAPARANSGHNAAHGLLNCSDCHFGTGGAHGTWAVPRGTTQGDKCKTCHTEGGQADPKFAVDLHKGSNYNTLVDCGSCHEIHNQFDFVTGDTHSGGVSGSNLEWIRPDTTKYDDEWGGLAALEPALFQANTGFFAWNDSNSPWNGICQTCHTQTDRHRNNNSPVNPHSHEVASACTGCHTHEGDVGVDEDGFKPQGGTCIGCHNKQQEISASPGTYRRQITEASAGDGSGEFSTSFRSHHVNDGTGSEKVTVWDCVVCHAEGDVNTGGTDDAYHKKDGVQLKDVDTGTVYADWASLTAAQRSDFCLSCHDTDGAIIIASRTDPDPDATTNALNPFNDGLTNSHEPDGFDGTPASHSRGSVVDVTSQFATGNTSHHAVLGAAYGSAAPFGSNVDNAIQGVRTDLAWNSTLDCEDCHYGSPTTMLSGHGTANARYMLRDKDGNDTYLTPSSTGNPNVICFRCHIPTGNPDDYKNTVSTFSAHDTGQHINDQLNLYGISCLNCHGGGEFGGIHGVDAQVQDDDSLNYYNPNVFTYGSTLDLISNWTLWGNNEVSCSALSAPTLLGNCTQHGSKNWGRGESRTYRNP